MSANVETMYTTRARFAELGLEWDPAHALRELEAEVLTYGQYEVYGFRLLEDGEEIESCWGTDWTANGLSEHLPAEARALLEVLE